MRRQGMIDGGHERRRHERRQGNAVSTGATVVEFFLFSSLFAKNDYFCIQKGYFFEKICIIQKKAVTLQVNSTIGRNQHQDGKEEKLR